MPPAYDLLAVDIDGTLLGSNGHVSPATRAALAQARAAGVAVVLCTGRRYSQSVPYAEELGLDVPLISAAGALVKHPAEDHRTLFVAEFPHEVLLACVNRIHAAGFSPIVYGDTYHNGFDFYCQQFDLTHPHTAAYFQRNVKRGREHAALLTQPPQGVFAGFTMGPEQEIRDLADRLDALVGPQISAHVMESPHYPSYMYEFAPAGVDKWSGVLHLAEDWGIAPERTCAVGDNINDLPMLRGAGLGVAMGNALPEVKAAADRICPSNDDDGIATVVHWLLDDA